MAKITITDNHGNLYTVVDVVEEDIATTRGILSLFELEMLHDLKLALKND